MMGRYLAGGEEGRNAPTVAILSYAFWRSRLGSDPQAVGKTITLDGLPHTVIGVMPQGFDYPRGTQLWRPLAMDESSQRPHSVTRPIRMINMVARLKPVVAPAQLEPEMARLTGTIRSEYPGGGIVCPGTEGLSSGSPSPLFVRSSTIARRWHW